MPEAWSHARLTCIPKADSPEATRPITIFAVVYRIWASCWAAEMAGWSQNWFDSSLIGGRPLSPQASHSAGEFAVRLSDAHVRQTSVAAAFLDTEKCFDSVELASLREIFLALGVPRAIFQVLSLWESLDRHVWFESSPTGTSIRSDRPRGILQGDPLAPWSLNLTMHTCNLCRADRNLSRFILTTGAS